MKKFRIIFFSMENCQPCKDLKTVSKDFIEEIKKNSKIEFTDHVIQDSSEELGQRNFKINGFEVKKVPVIIFTEYDDLMPKNEQNQTILEISKSKKGEFLIVLDKNFETFKKNYEDFLEIIAEAN